MAELPQQNTRLRESRKSAKITMLQMATLLDISENRFWKIEHGYIEPSDKQKAQIAKILHVKPDEIF